MSSDEASNEDAPLRPPPTKAPKVSIMLWLETADFAIQLRMQKLVLAQLLVVMGVALGTANSPAATQVVTSLVASPALVLVVLLGAGTLVSMVLRQHVRAGGADTSTIPGTSAFAARSGPSQGPEGHPGPGSGSGSSPRLQDQVDDEEDDTDQPGAGHNPTSGNESDAETGVDTLSGPGSGPGTSTSAGAGQGFGPGPGPGPTPGLGPGAGFGLGPGVGKRLVARRTIEDPAADNMRRRGPGTRTQPTPFATGGGFYGGAGVGPGSRARPRGTGMGIGVSTSINTNTSTSTSGGAGLGLGSGIGVGASVGTGAGAGPGPGIDDDAIEMGGVPGPGQGRGRGRGRSKAKAKGKAGPGSGPGFGFGSEAWCGWWPTVCTPARPTVLMWVWTATLATTAAVAVGFEHKWFVVVGSVAAAVGQGVYLVLFWVAHWISSREVKVRVGTKNTHFSLNRADTQAQVAPFVKPPTVAMALLGFVVVVGVFMAVLALVVALLVRHEVLDDVHVATAVLTMTATMALAMVDTMLVNALNKRHQAANKPVLEHLALLGIETLGRAFVNMDTM
jgi:hypothetical protein